MCGRRKVEKSNPNYESTLGDMDIEMVKVISDQLDPGTLVQLHWNGEPTLYKPIQAATHYLKMTGCYVAMDTNGLLIGDRWSELLLFDSITVSVIQGDSRKNYIRQIKHIIKFYTKISHFSKYPPMLNIRALGKIPKAFYQLAKRYNIQIIPRIFHIPDMSKNYSKHVTKPEVGVCMDLLNHPAIDRFGSVYPCVRFNPNGYNYLGNVNHSPLETILAGQLRHNMIDQHFKGNRDRVLLCSECDYYGIPRG